MCADLVYLESMAAPLQTAGRMLSISIQRPKVYLVVKVIEDAGNGHLLEELVLADARQGTVVSARPGAALHQNGKRRAI